ncbi:MAG: type-F conjugative transfer system pilin assembly protein TrbC [Rhodospirillales bacterium]|nr:type-F conjugative transfer system pilin assembly protein TrbC [Rhodospirillales bacterium]
MLHIVKSLGQRSRTLVRDGLFAVSALALCWAPALADDLDVKPDGAALDAARSLAAEVMHKAGAGDLGAWTRDIVDRALARAGEAARDASAETGTAAPPLPAERHAARIDEGLSARQDSAELLVFMSLSVPAASWRQWAREVALVDAPLLLRGVADGGLRATVKAVGERLGGAESGSLPRTRSGVAIDPRLFRLFEIERVPAVAVVPGGVPPCRSRGCADDPSPPHDVVAGNIGLAAALEAIAAEGEFGRDAARRTLERLGGER